MIGLVKRDVDLDDSQLQSLVHQLRHFAKSVRDAHAGALRGALQVRLQMELDTDPTVKAQRRAGLQARLNGATGKDTEPALAWALHHLRSHAIRAQTNLQSVLEDLARRRGQSRQEVTADFRRLRAAAPKGRQGRGDRSDRRSSWGLPQDPATRYALNRLRTNRGPRPPQRLISSYDRQITGHPGLRFGYHPAAQRLEVRATDGSVQAYRNVPADLAQTLAGDSPTTAAIAFTRLTTRPPHRYPDAVAADRHGWALRCDGCGQFAAAEHLCPTERPVVVAGEIIQYSAGAQGAATLRTVNADDTRRLVASGNRVELPVRLTCPGDDPALPDQHGLLVGLDCALAAGVVDGAVTIQQRAGDLHIDTGTACCNCQTYRSCGWCRHLRMTQALIREHLRRSEMPPEQVGKLAANLKHSGHILTPQSTARRGADRLTLAPDISTFRYSDDPERFAADCRVALATVDEHGGVPYLNEEAVYGYGAHRSFGVEVEYTVTGRVPAPGDRPGDDGDDQVSGHEQQVAGEAGSAAILSARIGTELHVRGLTDDAAIRDYGAAQKDEYVATTWSHERDHTVAGEVVSPLLTDEPRNWRGLDTVCQIVRSSGGGAAGTGAHVHVGAEDYANDPDRMTSLLRFLHTHEDELSRLACNPATPSRIGGRCRPVPAPPAFGFAAIGQAQQNTSRGSMVNLDHLDNYAPEKSHLEFRLFDGSLQPGRIQAQIKLALAVTDCAARHADTPDGISNRGLTGARRELGTGHRRNSRHQRDGLDATSTAAIRALIDLLFRRDIDKRQLAVLWGVSRYQTAPEAGGR